MSIIREKYFFPTSDVSSMSMELCLFQPNTIYPIGPVPREYNGQLRMNNLGSHAMFSVSFFPYGQ
jgi:hypothetical protein